MLHPGSGGLSVAETLHLGKWGEVAQNIAIARANERSYGILEAS